MTSISERYVRSGGARMCVCQVPVCLSLHPNLPPSSPASAHSEGFRKVKEMLLTRVLTSEKQLLCVPTEGRAVFLSVQGQGRRRLQTQRRGLVDSPLS